MVETCHTEHPWSRNVVHATSVSRYVSHTVVKDLYILNDVFHDKKIIEVEKNPGNVAEDEEGDDGDKNQCKIYFPLHAFSCSYVSVSKTNIILEIRKDYLVQFSNISISTKQ